MQTWLAQALARDPRTVLHVTHDIEEALVLGDRVVATLRVDAPRPRRRTDPALVALRERVLEELGA